MSRPRISMVVVGACDEARQGLQASDLEVIREHGVPDFGAALNRGFARARGEILGCIAAGERLLPGAIDRAAAQLRHRRDRAVVLGRAAFIVDGREDVAVPHPSEWLGLFDHLAVWERGLDSVARSSLFWHRSVLDGIGPFNSGEAFEVDYDFLCRVGRRFEVQPVPELWSALQFAQPARAEAQMMDALVGVSRRHWGPWTSPLRWQCELSYARYRAHAHERARHHARKAEAAQAAGRGVEAALERAKVWVLSPAMARGRFRRG